ncbi:MAG: hypothetical protein A2X55_02900 [Nitrospirae bacterium GWB2_47_37]|nr:MAG: hypothetical protein A2X55_02900 [Nitrospirae bacterium GWB2_47_37]HAK89042.1 hypothetical protein [Nitrospiraceae bacterium]
MNPKSAKTFVWAAVISILLGMAVMSPAGSFFLYSLAALSALIPIIFGDRRLRIAGAGILAASIALLAATYPEYDAEMTRYKERADRKSSEGVKPAPLPRQERRAGGER